MTTPVEQERSDLEQLVTALAYAQSAKVVQDALALLPGVVLDAVRLLFTIPQLQGALRLAPTTGAHAAVQATYRRNLVRRASYLAQAARRVSTSLLRGRDAALSALDAERRYLEQHLRADAQRTVAANQVAAQARTLAREAKRDGSTWNGLLGWHAVMDERTSAECRRANGRNFDPTRLPLIGYPGSVHPECRCRPGPPFATDKRVELMRPEVARTVTGRRRAKKATAWRVRRTATMR